VTSELNGKRPLDRVCVFCGSSPGSDPTFIEAAQRLGRILAERKLTAVFGGGSVGLMGALADSVIEAGGRIIGVIPDQLMARELGHTGLTELQVVASMHERKARLMELSDGFIALPGGAGTLEELSEVWTWAQLGIHRKPCGILNVAGYYAPFLALLDQMVEKEFLATEYRAMMLIDTEPEALLDGFETYRPPKVPQWLSRSEV
jgi:uncharacterized protein (TIGR00730 family)